MSDGLRAVRVGITAIGLLTGAIGERFVSDLLGGVPGSPSASRR